MSQPQKVDRLHCFLKALPHLELSDTGLKNVCNRFRISLGELKGRIAKMKSNKIPPPAKSFQLKKFRNWKRHK